VVTVTNSPDLGCLRIVKAVTGMVGTVPDVDFAIVVTGPSYPGGTTLTFNLVNGVISGAQDLDDLIPGSYTVAETPPAGWENAVITGSPATVEAGDACGNVVVTVTNTPVPPVCNTAVAAQGPGSGANRFPGASNWFTYIRYTKGAAHNIGEAIEYPIFTGQTVLCGYLYVWNTGNTLHVKYTMLDDGWIGFNVYHLQVDCSLEELMGAIVNQDGDGNPVPGQCEYQGTVDLVDEIPLTADITGCSDVYIFAHSDQGSA
jgi:hypothetical protein